MWGGGWQEVVLGGGGSGEDGVGLRRMDSGLDREMGRRPEKGRG